MHIEEFREYCLNKPAVTEGFPFGESTLVFKVAGKMFALCGVDGFEYINLKCDPERAIELREQFSCVRPGYHMNKAHWNSVYINQELSDSEVYKLVDHSYDLIKKSLPKKTRDGL